MEQTITKHQTSAIQTLQFITLAWMAVELCVALYSGVRAHSFALTAFGVDSAIELTSAAVVVRRFTLGWGAERRAARTSGFLLYGLAAYILITSAVALLSRSPDAEPTLLGMGLLIAAAIIMPLLGRAKKGLARQTGSRALNADAAQSNIFVRICRASPSLACWLTATSTFAGLILLPPCCFFPIVLKEAGEASKGEVCGC